MPIQTILPDEFPALIAKQGLLLRTEFFNRNVHISEAELEVKLQPYLAQGEVLHWVGNPVQGVIAESWASQIADVAVYAFYVFCLIQTGQLIGSFTLQLHPSNFLVETFVMFAIVFLYRLQFNAADFRAYTYYGLSNIGVITVQPTLSLVVKNTKHNLIVTRLNWQDVKTIEFIFDTESACGIAFKRRRSQQRHVAFVTLPNLERVYEIAGQIGSRYNPRITLHQEL